MWDLRRLPKAHLHVHVESAIRPETLRAIGAANGVSVPAALGSRFDGFSAFADLNALVRDCLRRRQDFARIGRELCEDEAAQGTRYLEVTFTAAAHGERLGDMAMPLEGLLEGLAEGGAPTGLEWRVILDHSRRRSVERAWETFRLARQFLERGVIAIGLAGDEAYPLAPFAEVLAAARAEGLHMVHHAGEASGPASIREALDVGHAERIGHGFRALEDEALVAELRERRLPLEVCPSSNVALGLVPSFAEHPFPRLLEAGLLVTLNADIPSIVGTTLAAEYGRVRDTFALSDEVLAILARASIQASFAPVSTKSRLLREVDEWLRAA